MKNLIRFACVSLLGLITLAYLAAPDAKAQFCGGSLRYVVLDAAGKTMDAEMMKEVEGQITVGSCGEVSQTVTLTFRGQRMRLLFRGISEYHNNRFLVHLPPFAEGAFEADLSDKRECDALEAWPDRTCFVSAARWRRISESGSDKGSSNQSDGAIIAGKQGGANPHLAKGKEFAKAKKWAEAAAEFKGAVTLEPSNAEAREGLGDAYKKLEKYEDALAEYRELVKVRSDYARGHNLVGNTLEKLRRYEESYAPFKEAIRLAPGEAEFHYNYGYTLGLHGRGEDAIRELREAVRLDPKYVDAHTVLGIEYDSAGRYEEAAAALSDALRHAPTDEYAMISRVAVYVSLNRGEAAGTDAEKFLTTHGWKHAQSISFVISHRHPLTLLT